MSNPESTPVPVDPPGASWQVGDQTVQVSHLDRVYWPQTGFTKGEVLGYYQQIAPVMLPYFGERPVTLRLFPQGVESPSYYLRDCPDAAPPWIRRTPYQPKTRAYPVTLPLLDDAAGLIWFANEGAIEFHLWSARLPNLAQPDQAIFDLDPGEQATFAQVREAALRVHDILEESEIKSYPKTSGGRGLHIYVPLASGYSFEQVRGWVNTMGQRLATTYPELFVLAHGATHQGDWVTVDAAQNSLGRNTAAPYTLRANVARPTVSMPLTWDEVQRETLRPSDFTPQVALERVKRLGDLFAPVLNASQRLT